MDSLATSPGNPVRTGGNRPLPDVASEHLAGRAPSTRTDKTPLRKDGMNDQEAAGRTGEGAKDERLLALLRELVRKEGQPKAAELLGVSARTLRRTLGSGRLSPRVRDALELQRLSEGGDPPARAAGDTGELARRVERLESRVETLVGRTATAVSTKMRSTSAGQGYRREDASRGRDGGEARHEGSTPSW